jgi:hypothetical protein
MITAMWPQDRVSADVGRGVGAARRPDRSLSPTSLRLHAQALLASFEAGHPGLVTDRDLAGFGDEVTPAALELCRSGVWVRTDGGYRVVLSEALRMAHEVHRQMRQSRTQD